MKHAKALVVGIVVVTVLALIQFSGGKNIGTEAYPTAVEALPAAALLAGTVAPEPPPPAQAKAPDVTPAAIKAAEPAAPAPTAAEPKAFASPVPERPEPRPASPEPAPVSVRGTGGDRDCSDFGSHEEAQRFYLANGGPASDPHRLDRDNDGLACETL